MLFNSNVTLALSMLMPSTTRMTHEGRNLAAQSRYCGGLLYAVLTLFLLKLLGSARSPAPARASVMGFPQTIETLLASWSRWCKDSFKLRLYPIYFVRHNPGLPLQEAFGFPLEAVFPPKHVGRAVPRYLGPHHRAVAERAVFLRREVCNILVCSRQHQDVCWLGTTSCCLPYSCSKQCRLP